MLLPYCIEYWGQSWIHLVEALAMVLLKHHGPRKNLYLQVLVLAERAGRLDIVLWNPPFLLENASIPHNARKSNLSSSHLY
jgi:hypothetical protein